MTPESRPQVDANLLEIVLDRDLLPVSNLSSLLRVMQATFREAARSREGSRQAFAAQPAPVLHLSTLTEGKDLVLRFSFTDPLNHVTLPELSKFTFGVFMEQFELFLKGLPQPGLWGATTRGSRGLRHNSELVRRLDEVRVELRRFPRVRLRFGRQVITFEGDRMEIS